MGYTNSHLESWKWATPPKQLQGVLYLPFDQQSGSSHHQALDCKSVPSELITEAFSSEVSQIHGDNGHKHHQAPSEHLPKLKGKINKIKHTQGWYLICSLKVSVKGVFWSFSEYKFNKLHKGDKHEGIKVSTSHYVSEDQSVSLASSTHNTLYIVLACRRLIQEVRLITLGKGMKLLRQPSGNWQVGVVRKVKS